MIQSKNTTNTTNNNNNNNNNEEDEEEEEEDDDDGMAWHGMSIQEDTRGYKKIQPEPEPLITERVGLAANDFCRQGRNLMVTRTDSTNAPVKDNSKNK